MMRFIFLALVVMIAVDSAGQYEPRDETMPSNLNSVGTNLTPGVIFLINAYPSVPRYTIHYKRQQQINRKLRFSVNYEVRDRYEESLEEGNVVAVGDSIIVFNLERAFDYIVDVRGGMEWFKPNKTATMVYGVDLYVGYQSTTSGYETVTLQLMEEGFIPHPDVDDITFEKTITYGLVGFDFSIGSKLQASEKLDFVIRWTPQFGYKTPLDETYSDPTQRTEPAQGSVDFHLRLLEVYVNYIF